VVEDQLSEVLELVGVRGLLSDGFALTGPWKSSSPVEDAVKLVAVVRGSVELSVDGVPEPLGLGAGDVAVLNGRTWMRLRGGGDGPPLEVTDVLSSQYRLTAGASSAGAGTVLLGGSIDLDPTGRALLLSALPSAGVVRAGLRSAGAIRDELDRVVEEVSGERIGRAFALRQRGQLLALEILRSYVEQADLPPGWLALLADEGLRPALAGMHADPGRPWSLDELASAAKMSRTTFAQRFRSTAGLPPLSYLARWRMLLAQRALRDGTTGLRALAADLGYASESAFSTAFKRVVGEAPAHYRSRLRDRTVRPDGPHR
jgi:AraC-like DNA-binding protein